MTVLRPLGRLLIAAFLGTVAAAGLSASPAAARTVTLSFDPPEFATGQPVTTADGVRFLDDVVTFEPDALGGTDPNPFTETASPPNALWRAVPCDVECENGSYRMRFELAEGASELTVHVGAEHPDAFWGCFPEGATCPASARLIGFASDGSPVAVSRDVLVYDNGEGPITHPVNVSDSGARIRSALLVVGKETFGSDRGDPRRAVIDELVYTVPDGPVEPPPPPAPPSISLAAPTAGALYRYPYSVAATGTVSVPAGLLGFCVRINQPAAPPPTSCNQTQLIPDGRSFNAPIRYDELRVTQGGEQSDNTIHVFAYDVLGRLARADVAIALLRPPPPRVTLEGPKRGWVYTDHSFMGSGSAFVPGGPVTACLRPAAAPALTQAECHLDGHITPKAKTADDYLFSSLRVTAADATYLAPGLNAVTAYLFDRWGQRGSANGKVELDRVDVRVNGIDVFQAVQSGPVAQDVSRPNRYQGTTLVPGKPTYVRVYAGVSAGRLPSNRITALLRVNARFKGDEVPVALATEEWRPPMLETTTGVSYAQRADRNAAITFRLPRFVWDKHARGYGPFWLRAELRTNWPVKECAGCSGNNAIELRELNFFNKAAPITINPVEMQWYDGTGWQVPPPPSEAFAATQAVSASSTAGFSVLPYQGQVDVTDIMTRSGVNKVERTYLLLDKLSDWRWDNPRSGYTMGLFDQDLFDQNLGGLEAPYFWLREPLAVADGDRQLTVAHEFFHQLGYFHAGVICSSGPTTFWPPDELGLLGGIGFDSRPPKTPSPTEGPYRILAAGASPKHLPQYFDLMSYCSNDKSRTHDQEEHWVSPRNWEAFGSALPNGVPVFISRPDRALHSSAPSDMDQADNASAGPVLRATALIGRTGPARVVSVRRLERGPDEAPTESVSTGIRLIARDSNGHDLASASMSAAPTEGSPGLTQIDGSVPAAGVGALEITRDGEVIARRTQSANAPSVRLGERRPSVKAGRARVDWTAKDPDGEALTARVEYAGGADLPFAPVWLGPADSAKAIRTIPLPPSKKARIRVTVSDGFRTASTTTRSFKVPPRPPMVEIGEPAPGRRYRAGQPVFLTGRAVTAEGDLVPASRLHWNVGGRRVATGLEASLPASPAMQKITLKARSGELQGAASVRVRVEPRTPRFTELRLAGPVAAGARRATVLIAASLPARVSISGQGVVSHTARVGLATKRLRVGFRRRATGAQLKLRLRAHGRQSSARLKLP